MKIVILDAYTLNPGDLNWDALEKFGTLKIYDRSTVEETSERVKDADIVLTNKSVLTAKMLASAPRLRYIGVMATGYNVVDMNAARDFNIIVSNIPAYSTPSVAQLVFAFILAFSNQVSAYNKSVKEGDWVSSKDFSYQVKPLIEIKDKTLGIVGFGQIGQAVAKISLAFGMRVIVSHKHPQRDKMVGVTFTDVDEVFEKSDFVSLHCPLNAQNDRFVKADLLRKMKRSAFFINTSRGGLVNEADLADALNNGVIAGAALDVLSTEPPEERNPLLHAKNCMITPHIAWASKEARERLLHMLEENIKSFLTGEPKNVVNE